MQKDFKIGLAIGVALAAGAVIWLSTLPKLSARARALEAASNANPSPKIPAGIQSPPGKESRTMPSPNAVEGSDESRAAPAPSDEPRVTSDETQQRIHIVQKGDTLSSISAKYYGSARQWRKIVTANRDNLPDPNRLIPGVKLIIPN